MLEFILLLFFREPQVLPQVSPMEQQIFELVNEERETNLVWNDCLAETARTKSRLLHTDNYFDHKHPLTGENEAWADINDCYFLGYKTAGENLGRDFKTAPVVHRAWMNSPTHKDNIVDEKFTEIGVGCVDIGDNWICTQHFAKP